MHDYDLLSLSSLKSEQAQSIYDMNRTMECTVCGESDIFLRELIKFFLNSEAVPVRTTCE